MLPDCPFCGHQNPAAAKFCNECGSPLHLTPCSGCGAVNNLGEAQCWRCAKVLLSPAASPTAPRLETRPGAPALLPGALAPPTEQELERELAVLEREVQDLTRAPGREAKAPERRAPERRDTPRPARPPVLRDVVAEPRVRPSWVMAAVLGIVGVLALAIGGGTYLHGLGLMRATGLARISPPGPLQAAAPAALGVLRDLPGTPGVPAAVLPPTASRPPAPAPAPEPQPEATPPEARVVREVREAAAALAPGADAPGPAVTAAPADAPPAGDAGAAAAAPPAAAAPGGASCPPAVEAMALCDWVGDGKRP
jgi:hypothetical protein